MAKAKEKDKEKKADKPEKSGKAKSSKGGFLSLVKSLALALVLAFLVRIFLFEIFKIPSCSMEPTLEGIDLSHGDRVGVNKLAYVFGDVNRYDVVVFEGTADVGGRIVKRDYIKRVAGLPGEDISIIAGDLYVNGQIAPKPMNVQDSVWIPLYEEDFSSNGWQHYLETDGEWSVIDGALRGNSAKLRYLHWERVYRSDKIESSFITSLYPRIPVLKEVVSPTDGSRFNPRYQDCYSYENRDTGEVRRGFINPTSAEEIPYEGRVGDSSQPVRGDMEVDFWLGGKSNVGDLYIEMDVTPRVRSGSISITLGRGNDRALDADPHTIQLAIGPGPNSVYRTRDKSVSLPETSRLTADKTSHIIFAIWDGQVHIDVDGKMIHDTTYVPNRRELNGNFVTVELGDKTVADIDNLQLKRDLYYISVDAGRINPYQTAPGSYKVPEGRYFMLGDNSPASSDCRFSMPPVLRENIVGRAFFLLWPPRNWKRLPPAN